MPAGPFFAALCPPCFTFGPFLYAFLLFNNTIGNKCFGSFLFVFVVPNCRFYPRK